MEMFLKLAAAAWFLFRDSKNQSANPTPALATPQPMPTAVNAGVQGTPNPNLGTPGTQLAGTPNIPRTLPVVGAMMFQGPTLLTGPTDTSNGQLPAAVAVFPEPAKPLPVVVRYLPQPAPPENEKSSPKSSNCVGARRFPGRQQRAKQQIFFCNRDSNKHPKRFAVSICALCHRQRVFIRREGGDSGTGVLTRHGANSHTGKMGGVFASMHTQNASQPKHDSQEQFRGVPRRKIFAISKTWHATRYQNANHSPHFHCIIPANPIHKHVPKLPK